jgi:hypothetical protein
MIKSFPIKEGAYLTVLNREFLEPIITVIEKFGFTVVSVTPVFVLGVDTSKTPFNKEMALQALANFELLSNYSYLTPEQVEAKLDVPEPFLSVQLNGKIIALIAVFGVLVAILIVLMLNL